MKKIIILSTLALMFNSKLLSQNDLYIVTEKYNSPLGFLTFENQMDSLFVASPAGITTGYKLPHYLSSTGAHDAQLSVIINSITSLGYRNVSNNDWSGIPVYFSNNASYSKPEGVIRTLIFAKPWTTASSELEEVKSSQMKIKIYPNPSDGYFSMEIQCLEGFEPKEMVVINSMGYIVYRDQISCAQGEINNFDLSKLSSGIYFVRLLNNNYFSKPEKIIIN